jgi:PP-loop superfamily ATP-utilizing enzyme
MSENSPKPRKVEDNGLARELAASGASLSEISKLARAEAITEALPEPALNASTESSVNKITWARVERVTEPGRYMFKFGWLTITVEDLAVWEQYPNAAFALLRTAPAAETEDEFRLGTFDLRENISLSDK